MIMPKREPKYCYYCNACVTGNCEDDHFPLPKNVGGEMTVPCCVSCHDMKDRFALENWPVEWVTKMVEDLPKLSRETKLFLAKVARLGAEMDQLTSRSGQAQRSLGPAQVASYESKFSNFIEMCNKMEKGAVVVVAMPEALGDTYAEMIESLNRLSAADLHLAIAPRSERKGERSSDS
jgi:hypothetical protein